MWFDEEDTNLEKRLFFLKRKRRKLLNVSMRVGGKANPPARKVGLAAAVAAAVLVALLLAAYGLCQAGQFFFSQNSRFTVRNLIITEGPVLKADRIKEYMQLSEGMNLFGLNITRTRRDFLAHLPNVRKVEIVRELPDTLRISVEERDPVARIGKRSYLVADREGWLFQLRTGASHLPVVSGLPESGLSPGSNLVGSATLALDVLNACRDAGLPLTVQEIDVSQADFVTLFLRDGLVSKEVILAWKEMGKGSADSRKDLVRRLQQVITILQTEEGRRRAKIDATLEHFVGSATG